MSEVAISPPNGECNACGWPKPKNKACAVCGAFNRADRPVITDPNTTRLVARMVDAERLRIRTAQRGALANLRAELSGCGADHLLDALDNATKASKRKTKT